MEQELVKNISTILDLGTSALLLYLLLVVWKDRKETIEVKDAIISEKDSLMEENRKEVLGVVRHNTLTQERLTNMIDKSINATETLTARIYQILERNNNGH
jgi:hypothetical protein